MKSYLKHALAGLCLAARGWAADPAPASPDAAATVVVFNEKDAVSTELAGLYADKRGIPFDHLIGLSCPPEETISRADYDRLIAGPLKKEFLSRGWWRTVSSPQGPHIVESSIRFVALIRGIPLKIAAVPGYPGDQGGGTGQLYAHNEAAVDSELAVLGNDTPRISGPLDNPYYRSFTRLEEAAIPSMLLVCRLDAADATTVRRMISDSLAAEKTGLRGFAYVDSRNLTSGGLALGDDWLRHVADDVTRHGIPCVYDAEPTLFPEHYPMRHMALYFGWYSEQVAGAFKDDAVRFVPGAVAVHLHSFSAASLRPPLTGWCAPLLARGAAATLGNVYEPYLHLTPNLDLFEERLRSGFTFAEAAYASQKVLSWMTTFIGDPLYRPFRTTPEKTAVPPSPEDREWAAYREGVRLWFSQDRSQGEAALQEKGRALKSGLIFEGLGGLQAWAKDPNAAMRSWARARDYYRDEADQARCVLRTIEALRGLGKKDEALVLTMERLEKHPQSETAPLLRSIEAALRPPPPASVGPINR